MSSHANVILDYGQTHVLLYTHRFGFPAETGAAIVEALRHRGGPEELLRALLKVPDASKPCYNPEFMLTFGIHRDVHWIYRIVFETTSGADQFTISLRQSHPQKARDAIEQGGETRFLNLNEFILAVNTDRRAINEELRKTPAGAPVTPLFEMLPLT